MSADGPHGKSSDYARLVGPVGNPTRPTHGAPGVASARGVAIVEVLRSALATLDTLEPAEQAAIVGAIVGDLRARRLQSVEPLSVLPPPADRIRDPRAAP